MNVDHYQEEKENAPEKIIGQEQPKEKVEEKTEGKTN